MGFVIAAILAMLLVGCAPAAGQEVTRVAPTEQTPARLLIIDTDTGADDATALILAARDPNVKILGVTTLAGNVSIDQGTRNALEALERAGCDVPVYRGSTTKYNGRAIEPFSVFGKDGMGDAGLVTTRGEAQELDAVDFMIQTVRQHPGEVEIVVLGPATNIAKAIDRDPEAMAQVKTIWSMGTAGLGPGNASPVAEFNVLLDAPAYKRMLDSGLPVTVVGLDMCMASMLTEEQFAQLENSGKLGEFVAKAFGELRKLYAKNGEKGTANCDAVTMTCVLQDDFVTKTRKCHASCITTEGETYGQVLLYMEGKAYDRVSTNGLAYNVTLVTDVEGAKFFERLLAAVSSGS